MSRNALKIQENLAEVMDKVCESHTPINIIREDKKSTVLISIEDHTDLYETAHLFDNFSNSKVILSDIGKNKHKHQNHLTNQSDYVLSRISLDLLTSGYSAYV
ncbi:type II toxin-antitoxin system Phd/YefM family antitoxin [Marinomonas sp. NPDC078689]|uniref:type II toxin-antitoxin system Phd/YefM family antitoxin n=1 Tax=Marinomonas sp. NPDC078689 TaxID=3364147 RepID=UPI0037C8D746